MTVGKIAPAHLNLGDNVIVNKQLYSVHDIQGPDYTGAYDAYLQTNNGQVIHQVVTEPVTIIMQ